MFFFRKNHQRKTKPGYIVTILLVLVLVLAPAIYTIFTRINSAEATITPIANWKFDEGYGTTTAESISNTNTGTLAGATLPTWQTEDKCIAGKCLYFDGSTSEVTVASTASFKSVSMWVRPISVTTGALADFGSNIRITVSSGVVSATGFTSPTIYIDGKVTTTLVADRWQHVSVTSGTTVSGASMQFGNYSTTFLNGYLDEIRMYTDEQPATVIKGDMAARGSQRTVSAQMGQAPTSFLSDGLTAYWNMDETSAWATNCSTASVLDRSGNGNNGAPCPNASAVTQTSGKFNKAGNFDGTNDYISVPTASFVPSGNFTISAWVKPTDLNQDLVIVGVTSGNNFYIVIPATTAEVLVYGGSTYAGTSAGAITAGVWQHVVVTHPTSTTYRVYVNGVDLTTTPTGDSLTTLTSVNIGRFFSDYFKGQIDEVRFYNRILSSSEINQLYQWSPTPVLNWKLDENTGTTANDTSTNALSGTLTNTPTWALGKYGAGVNVAGSNQHIIKSDDVNLDFGAGESFTLETWFKHSTASSQEVILSKFNEAGYKLIMESDGDITCGLDYDSTWTPTDSVTSTAATYDDGNWHHIACVKNENTSLTLYIDGVSVATPDTSLTNSTLANSDALYYGIDADGTSNDFVGVLDNLTIYSYARTAGQVVEDMNGGHPAGGSPVGSQITQWKFDELQNTTTYNTNATYSTLTGAISGATWRTSDNCKTNGCLDFDGSNDVVTVTNADPIDLDVGLNSGFTISQWVRVDTVGESSAGQIFSKGTNRYCQLSGSTPFTLTCNLDFATTDANVAVSSALAANVWSHVALTYDSSTNRISLWINGYLRGTSSAGTGGLAADSSNLLIGGDTANNFDGRIDDFQIYNSPLSAEQIKIAFDQGASVNLGTSYDESSTTYGGQGGNPPVGIWSFDENTDNTCTGGTNDACDRSTNGNDGAKTNMSATNWVAGKHGQALDYDGSDDYVSVADQASLDLSGSFTIAAWVKMDTLPGASNGYFIAEKGTTGANYNFAFYYFNTQGLVCSFAGTADHDIAYTPTANVWTHYACVFDTTANIVRLYINGIPVLTEAETTNTTTNADPMWIGRSEVNTNYEMDGQIDDLRIYDYARSQAQIAYDYNRGEPAAWWKFDECSGTTLNNSAYTGSTYNGTWTGITNGSNTAIGDCTTVNTATAWYNGRNGKFNSSLDFDGNNDTVNFGDVSFTEGASQLTWAFWVNPASLTTSDQFLSKANGLSLSQEAWAIGTGGSAATTLAVYIATSNTSLNAVCSVANTLATGAWMHIAIVFDGTETGNTQRLKFFINGRQVPTGNVNCGSDTVPSSTVAASTTTLRASGTSDGAQYYDGQLDDIRIYTYPLSVQQIRKVYNAGAAVRFGPVTGYPGAP